MRITESQLRRIVKRVINEYNYGIQAESDPQEIADILERTLKNGQTYSLYDIFDIANYESGIDASVYVESAIQILETDRVLVRDPIDPHKFKKIG